ncbi:MAG TPA: GcrA family cell cycle regulator, partial [Bryobacteraceae bacterium]|nr:GcrA family cell cycle regulator [Bryobacteraceae bacterium]
MLWTEALSDKITLLWETQSATEIASTLGVEDKIYVTRNAVVGKLHRLKLTINNKKVVRKGGPRITRTPE